MRDVRGKSKRTTSMQRVKIVFRQWTYEYTGVSKQTTKRHQYEKERRLRLQTIRQAEKKKYR